MTVLKIILLLILTLSITGCGKEVKLRTAKLTSVAESICQYRQGVYSTRWDLWDGIIYCYDGSYHRIPSAVIDSYTNDNLKNYIKE